MKFIDYYRDNLAHIRGVASEFAAEFPKIASRLELSALDCQDPYVERILEGTAFLAARVEKKLESGFPRLLESVLTSVSPLALYPTPSYSIIEMKLNHSDEQLKKGKLFKKGSKFQAQIPGIKTPCQYTTMCDMKLYPIELEEATYLTNNIEQYALPTKSAFSALYMKFNLLSGNLSGVDSLPFFLNMPEQEAALMQCLLMADLEGIYIRRKGTFERVSEQFSVTIPLFKEEGCQTAKVTSGLQDLQHYLAYPALLKFIMLQNCRQLFEGNSSAEIIFAFKRREPIFTNMITSESFKLWAVPVVNLFRKHTDRTEFHGQYEQHVVPERMAPMDYEVFKVLSVEAFDERNNVILRCSPDYEHVEDLDCASGYFFQHRRDRLTSKDTDHRTSYPGTEVFMTLAGRDYEKNWEDVRQFQTESLCTNRDLPLLLRMTDQLTSSHEKAIQSVSFLSAPSAPSEALISKGTEKDWQHLGYIIMNLSGVLWNEGDTALSIIKKLLKAYSKRSEEETTQLIDGLMDLQAVPKQFRFIHKGSVFFESGWHIDITFREEAYAGIGVFTFAYILKELLLSYTPMNSCQEITIHTDKRKGIVTWRA